MSKMFVCVCVCVQTVSVVKLSDHLLFHQLNNLAFSTLKLFCDSYLHEKTS
jgi:hypothetical protein